MAYTVAVTGDLTVGGGGLLRSSILENPRRMMTGIFSVAAGAMETFTVNPNACNTFSFTFPIGTNFTNASTVAVAIGQKISSGTNDQRLIITIGAATVNGATASFCNPTATAISFSNYTYSYIALGL